jgi:activating signal cointegrator complex subunit 3
MQEAPRLSGALRAKAGVRPEPLDRVLLARKEALAASSSSSSRAGTRAPSSSSSRGGGGGALDWETFAGPYCRSAEQHVRAVRTPFNAFLASAAKASGSEGSASDSGPAEALVTYVHCAAHLSQSRDQGASAAREKAACALLASQLHVASVPLPLFQTLCAAVAELEAWRRGKGVTPPLDASSLGGPGGGAAQSPASLPPGFHFNPIESAYEGASSRSLFTLEYGPLAALRPGFGGSSPSILDAVARETAEGGASSGGDAVSSPPGFDAVLGRPVDAVWLYAQSAQFVNHTRSALTPESVGLSILDALRAAKGGRDEGQLQSSLFELLGEGGLDFLAAILHHRAALVAVSTNDFRRAASAISAQLAASAAGASGFGDKARHRPVMGTGVTVSHAADRLLEKDRRKEKRKMDRANKTLADLGLDDDGGGGGGGAGGGIGGGGAGGNRDVLAGLGFSPEYLALERSLGLGAGGASSSGGGDPLYGAANAVKARAPTAGSGSGAGGTLSADEIIASVGAGFAGAQKRVLPEGTTEVSGEGFKEVTVPAARSADATGDPSRLVSISGMDPMAQKAFQGIDKLNRLQSELYEAAYRSNENLLVCAPTGAGKTNVAMLTVCREIAQHLRPDGRGLARTDDFKIIYVAPMKALAQEVVAKFGQRLSGLGLTVRELTGDTQLSKREIAETQVIVTTPEKWDVITRKAGDGSLVALVRLLIIDEVHLLADDRGAVIESIVARTLRLVETSQSVIRIVGLSATLPNYQDVAMFLRVNPTRGLFYFDSTYRPVPLQQTFVGVTEHNSLKRLNVMNKIAWDKAIAAVKRGKQVMVFVHSRKDTGKTARALRDLAQAEGQARLLSPFSGVEGEDTAGDPGAAAPAPAAANTSAYGGAAPSSASMIQGEGRVTLTQTQWVAIQREVDKSRNQELRELFPAGFAIHHAGMLRSDRNLTEKMFAAGVVKILCCTATLAWGVNLPAHTVIIKGTQVYDAEAGGFSDLGMLDVMQIFGRAGRPQFDTSGEGIIITGHERLAHYLSLLTAQVPIESSFIKSLPDHLNAEIASGTVTNVREAVLWLSYTYLYVRMLRNPLIYGISHEERMRDPNLDEKRVKLITDAAKRLDECHMIRFDSSGGNFAITDLGRVASHYYVVNESIDTFNRMMDKAGIGAGSGSGAAVAGGAGAGAAGTGAAPSSSSTTIGGGAGGATGAVGPQSVSDEDVLNLVCHAHEFTSLKVRDEELGELDYLRSNCRVFLKGDVATTLGKTNVLLQAFISNTSLRSFTLISDTAYITQSAGRISRALFEISLKKGWCTLAERLLTLSKAIDKRLWWTSSPLHQFGFNLAPDVLSKLEDSGYSLEELADLDPRELGAVVRHPMAGPRLSSLLAQVPRLEIETTVQPITRNILRLTVTVWPAFTWSDRIHGTAEPFWLWVEDAQSEHIYHSEYLLLSRRQVVAALSSSNPEPIKLVFMIPVFDPVPTQYWLRCTSDRWIGVGSVTEISFRHLLLPTRHPAHTDLLDLLPLPVAALRNPAFEAIYRGGFTHFNPVQTQMFFTVYNTDLNVLLGAPTGSGKTVAAELAVFRLLAAHPGKKVVYVAPLKALVSERLRDWRKKFGELLGKSVVELTGDFTPDVAALRASDIIITTPEKWDGITRYWQRRNYVQKVGLVIIDEIHLLGEDRGPVLEVIVSRMRYIASRTGQEVRFMGLSTAVANANDLADWLGVEGPGLFNFRPAVRPIPMEVHVQAFPGRNYCPRMQSMNKPAYAAITTYSPEKPVLIFVASRRQTRLTALDLIAMCATAENPKRFLRMSDEETASYVDRVKDSALRDTLAFGIGIHHAGLVESDRAIVEELYGAVKIQVLCCTATLAWGVNFPAHLVIVKGTEFYDARLSRYVDFPVTDVLQMMGRAGRPQYDDHGVAVIMVHEPKKNFYKKFLYEPFPVESHLRSALAEHLNAEVAGGAVVSRHDAVEYITWTYFFRRLLQNPTYYELEDATPDGVKAFLYGVVDDIFAELEESGCVMLGEEAVEALVEGIEEEEEAAAGAEGGGAGSGQASSSSSSRTLSGKGPRGSSALPTADDAVAPTSIGNITSYYYLSHTTAACFVDRLPRTPSTVEAVARLLTSCPEFAELPVRHNEDELNERWARDLPWPAAAGGGSPKASGAGAVVVDWASPHVKAFLLLQARLSHAAVPIGDYVTDTKSVMDQALRVLAALIDVAADGGYLGQTLAAAALVQCIVQGRMPGTHPVAQLPHMTDATADALAAAAAARASDGGTDGPSLRSVAALEDDEVRRALQSARLSAPQIGDVLRVLRSLPVPRFVCRLAPGTALPARVGDSVVIEAQLLPGGRQYPSGGGGGSAPRRAYAPRFGRAREYGWWLIAATTPTAGGGANADELLALRRVSGERAGTQELNVLVPAPGPDGKAVIRVLLVSDTLAGLEVDGAVEVEVAGVDENGGAQ